uniref:PDZ domain-containing protein n=1 Tax=Accipiter nisus TaxID=211598 RepID=A0A8B9M0U0_9AVES
MSAVAQVDGAHCVFSADYERGLEPLLDILVHLPLAFLPQCLNISLSLCFVAETPIEEFTPTPAFPALQYLESVDVEGVAWRAGLRTGDFLIEVNGVNVVKVGHKQVVSLIRQGGNHLVMKVVSVSRKPESEEVVRKKAPPPPKRAPSTTLTLRSKSMTAELEELGKRRQGLAHACRADALVSQLASTCSYILLKTLHPHSILASRYPVPKPLSLPSYSGDLAEPTPSQCAGLPPVASCQLRAVGVPVFTHPPSSSPLRIE